MAGFEHLLQFFDVADQPAHLRRCFGVCGMVRDSKDWLAPA